MSDDRASSDKDLRSIVKDTVDNLKDGSLELGSVIKEDVFPILKDGAKEAGEALANKVNSVSNWIKGKFDLGNTN